MSAADPALRVLWRTSLPAPDADLVPPGCRLHVEPDLDRALPLRDEIDVLVDARPSDLLDGAALRRVIVPFAGVPAALREAVLARPHLRLHNAHYNAPFVAQHAVALLLAAAHRLLPLDAALRTGVWSRGGAAPRTRHLAGGEALLLGYGAIGRCLAPMLHGLGMRVTALRRHPAAGDGRVREVGPDGLAESLARADAVVVSLPATSATEGLLDRAALAHLRPGTLLVNVGRAAVIDEAALFDALVEGRIGAAGLDVWWRYPDPDAPDAPTLPATRPFWTLPNVVLSPHRGDATDASERARGTDVCATLAALIASEERSRVDVDEGY